MEIDGNATSKFENFFSMGRRKRDEKLATES